MSRVRSRFAPRVPVLVEPGNEPGAKQSMKEECDINTIMAKYVRTGTLTHINVGAPQFGFAPDMSFKDAMNLMVEAEAEFMRLPAKVRARFSNDPALFVDFCSKRENLDELRKLGLAPEEKKAPVPEPVAQSVT